MYVPLWNPQQKKLNDTSMKVIVNWWWTWWFIFIGFHWWIWKDIPLVNNFSHCSCEIRNIAIPVSSSGITATLFERCHMAFSASKLPSYFQTIEHPTCNIVKHPAMAKVLVASKIIMWNECTHWKHLTECRKTCAMTRNILEAQWFPPNTANHSKIDCCRWNISFPQITKSMVLCDETSAVGNFATLSHRRRAHKHLKSVSLSIKIMNNWVTAKF